MKKVLIFLGIIIVLFSSTCFVNKYGKTVRKYPRIILTGKTSLHPETIALLDDENYQNIILPNVTRSRIKGSRG